MSKQIVIEAMVKAVEAGFPNNHMMDYGNGMYCMVGEGENSRTYLMPKMPEGASPDGISDYDRRSESLAKALKDCGSRASTIIRGLMFFSPFFEMMVLPSAEDKGRFSYARDVTDTDENRVKTRFGRIIRRQFEVGPEIIQDHELAEVNEYLLHQLWDLGEVEELFGDDIIKFYRDSDVSSCMSGRCAQYVELYAHNPKKVSLLVTYNGSCEGVGRALLWRTDNHGLVLDRAYGNHEDAMAIVAHAMKMGAKVSDRPMSNIIGCGDSGYECTVYADSCSYMPYLDSFRYIKRGSSLTRLTLCNRWNKEDHMHTALESTGGDMLHENLTFNDEEEYRCTECGEHLSEDDVYNDPDGDINCRDCFNNNCAYCVYCGEGHWLTNSIDLNGRAYCHHCYQRHFFLCNACGIIHENSTFNGRQQPQQVFMSLRPVIETQTMCASCYIDKAGVCATCDTARPNTDLVEYNGVRHCIDCIDTAIASRSEELAEVVI